MISRYLIQTPSNSSIGQRLSTDTTGLLTRCVGVSFKSENLTIEGCNRALLDHIDPALLNTIDEILHRPCRVTVWYVPAGGVKNHVQDTPRHFQHAPEKHLPPLHQYLKPGTQELDTDMDMPSIRHFQGAMYCKFPVKGGVEDVTQTPRSFWTLPTKLCFQTSLEFQIYYSVGVIREYQWQRGRLPTWPSDLTESSS